MFGNMGGLISTWSFLPFDGPDYHIGNGSNLATSCTILIIAVLLWTWMHWDNSIRDKKDAGTELADDDLDWRHPSFRWKA